MKVVALDDFMSKCSEGLISKQTDRVGRDVVCTLLRGSTQCHCAGAHMFWWLYYNEKDSTPSNLPLVLWLQGGPVSFFRSSDDSFSASRQ